MTFKKLTDQQLRIERIRYDLLVEKQSSSIDFNENIYEKVRNFFVVTVGIGIMLAWLSSSPGDSNLYKVYDAIKTQIPYGEVLLKVQVPIFAILIWLYLQIFGAKNKVRKLVFKSLFSYVKQDELFKSFITKLIVDKEKVNIEDEEKIVQLWDIIKNKDIYDICFDKADFEDYLKEHLKKYINKFPLFFLSNFTYLILYNECVENTLVHGSDDGNHEFTSIISKNDTIL